jgi:tRNA G37 N-methylase Trm5
MTQAEIMVCIESIHECNTLLLKDADDITCKDLEKADRIIMSLLGKQFHFVATSLLNMKMKQEEKQKERKAKREAQRSKNSMNYMLGLAKLYSSLWW